MTAKPKEWTGPCPLEVRREPRSIYRRNEPPDTVTLPDEDNLARAEEDAGGDRGR